MTNKLGIHDLFESLRKKAAGIPAFDPEADMPEIVRPMRVAAHAFLIDVATAQRVAAAAVRKAASDADLTDAAKQRLRGQGIAQAREAIAKAHQELTGAREGTLLLPGSGEFHEALSDLLPRE